MHIAIKLGFAAVLLLNGIVAACGGQGAGGEATDPAPVPWGELSERFGCDETLVAKDPKSTVVLAVRAPGLLRRALDAGFPHREELPAGGPEVDIRLEQGADLDHWCTDMMARPPRIDATWIGREGTAAVTVLERLREPAAAHRGSWRVPTRASVELIEVIVELQGSDGATLEIPDLVIETTIGEPAGG